MYARYYYYYHYYYHYNYCYYYYHLPIDISQLIFQLVEERSKLVDNRGYSYKVKTKRNYVTYWQCSFRQKYSTCSATVIERGELFKFGCNQHNHPAAVDSAEISKAAVSQNVNEVK